MNRNIAVILSFVYCGLGQIYRGHITKGIIFVLIYTALTLSILFPLAFEMQTVWDKQGTRPSTFSSAAKKSLSGLPETPSTHLEGRIVPVATVSNLRQLILVILLILSWLTGIVDAYIDYDDMKSLRAVWISVVFSSSVAMIITLSVWPKAFTQIAENVETNVNRHLIQPTYTKTESQEAQVSNPESQKITLQESSTEQQPESQERITPKIKTTPMSDIAEEKRTIISRIKRSINVEKDNKASSVSDFFVQVGAFSEKKRAESFVQQLKEQGYSAIITGPLKDENPTMYRVRIGSYRSRNEAKKSAKELSSKLGINVIVIKQE